MYTLQKAKKQTEEVIKKVLGNVKIEINTPPENIGNDLAVPVFHLAKEAQQSPQKFSGVLAHKIDLDGTLLGNVEEKGGFVNFDFDKQKYAASVLEDIKSSKDKYGSADQGEGKTIVMDYSSPNIAKPLSIAHFRSTMIGQAIKNILKFQGYNVIGDNHIGDWGTQFGKLLRAYEKWGDKEQIEKDPIKELLNLYVKYHKESKDNPELDNEARVWFKKLEDGDKEAKEIWQWMVDMSMKAFNKTYKMLGVDFEEVLGESFYNEMLDDVVKEALDKGVATWEQAKARKGQEEDASKDEKVALVNLEDEGIETPLLIQKSDGTSLYATRDFATAQHRINTWNPDEILYVTGGEQELYFSQVFAALKKLGYDANYKHIKFGLMNLGKLGKMSTREGKVIFLEEVLDEAIERAKEVLRDRDLSEEEKEEIATKVGIGAVKYFDLSRLRTKTITFDWDEVLNLEGDSAPYLQYQVVRIKSILKKAGEISEDVDVSALSKKEEYDLVQKLAQFPEVVLEARKLYMPHIIANYTYDLAQSFSKFYNECPIMNADDEKIKAIRLHLAKVSADILIQGLGLLSIDVPERM